MAEKEARGKKLLLYTSVLAMGVLICHSVLISTTPSVEGGLQIAQDKL